MEIRKDMIFIINVIVFGNQMEFKTIKELDGKGKKYFDENYTAEFGYFQALNDVLELIDEIPPIDILELKARIEG